MRVDKDVAKLKVSDVVAVNMMCTAARVCLCWHPTWDLNFHIGSEKVEKKERESKQTKTQNKAPVRALEQPAC